MDLNGILEQWSQDCEIGHNLDDASRETPKPHAKYLMLYSQSKLLLKREENRQHTLLKQKFLWYNGKMSREETTENGWEPDPFDGLKIMKTDMNYWYESDTEIQDSESKVVYYKTLVDTLKEIVDVLKWRSNTIKNIIEVRRFEAGG